MRESEGEVPERFLDKHRRDSSHAKLQEEDLLVGMLPDPVGDFLVLLLILLSFQKVAVATYPGETLGTTVGATGNQLVGHSRLVLAQRLNHFLDGFHGIPYLISTLTGTLEETMIALYLGHLILGIELHELCVLICC